VAFVEAVRYLNALPSDVKSGFSLLRLAARCDEAAQAGALHGIWPVLTAMTATTVTSPKIPTGTLDILQVAAKYVTTVASHLPPDEVVPPEVRAFAASKGKTKAALEARPGCGSGRDVPPARSGCTDLGTGRRQADSCRPIEDRQRTH